MVRGNISTKKIWNLINKQVTYSNRRKRLFKKANELTILCDAKVSIIMISSSGKLSDFISHSTTTKEIFDMYQKTLGVDLMKNNYEKMQEDLRKLEEENKRLKREMRQRMGEDLSELDFSELHRLEQEMESSFSLTHSQFHKRIDSKSMILKKKNKQIEYCLSTPRNNHVGDVDPKLEDGKIVGNGGPYDSAVATTTSRLSALSLHDHTHRQ